MTLSAFAIAAATLGAGLLAAYLLRCLPTVRLQLAGLALIAVCLPLASVLFSGFLMYHMGDDVRILAISAAAALVAVIGGLVVARSIAGRIDALEEASEAIAGGDLSTRASTDGPAEIAKLAGAFNEMAGSLEQLFEARRELVAWASHDLRTPLANMQALLEATEDGLKEPAEALPVLREQVAVLTTLVDDLFELARIDAGSLTLELEDASLTGLVEGCLRGVEAEARRRGIAVATETPGDVRARCAPDKIERVLLNLLTNALRHTPSDGTVAVRVAARPAEVQVTVEDTGEGLDDEAEKRMFERFWRGDRARAGQRAGLGLAIARGLVEAHGGRIWAENRPGGGAAISFTLPS
ncbi:MAG: sensor histidine kinase [Gaiella sp.]